MILARTPKELREYLKLEAECKAASIKANADYTLYLLRQYRLEHMTESDAKEWHAGAQTDAYGNKPSRKAGLSRPVGEWRT